jgi:hypothetical protein
MTARKLTALSMSHHGQEGRFRRANCRDSGPERKPTAQRYFVARRGGGAPVLEKPMRFASSQVAIFHGAMPQDAGSAHASVERQRRVATTATLLALALCAVTAKGHLLTRAPAATTVAPSAVTAPAAIIAPEFCKDQTWPYIDSRCLHRVDNPAPDSPPVAVVSATTAAATPAPIDSGANTVNTTPRIAEPSTATNAPPAGTAPNPTDTRTQVIQSVFPAAAPSAAPDTGAYSATNAYTRAANASQRRRSEHWNNHSGFFGFRF